MDIVFLGTGGGEGIPSIFCNCSVCQYARKNGGKDLRSRMGMLINDDLLLDVSPDIRTEILKANVNLLNIKNVIITHSHSDHLSVDDLIPQICYVNGGTEKILDVYSNKSVKDIVDKGLTWYTGCGKLLKTHLLNVGETTQVGKYKVTAFLSRHMSKENSFYYLIDDGKKRYLHLCDGGVFLDDTIKLLSQKAQDVNLVVYDMTFGLIHNEYFGHMNYHQVQEARKILENIGVVTKKTHHIATHICHWGGTHEDILESLKDSGITVAFDGMKISI